MSHTEINCLCANLELGHGTFLMHPALHASPLHVRVNVLSGWVNDINAQYKLSLGEYFIHKNVKDFPRQPFGSSFEAFKTDMVKNKISLPDDIEAVCFMAYEVWHQYQTSEIA